MAGKDSKKRQEKLMKQRRRAKERQKKLNCAAAQVGAHGMLRKARFSRFSTARSASGKRIWDWCRWWWRGSSPMECSCMAST